MARQRQFNRYAAGRKVYGGGRSNPTSGTVDPTGYIERSANNMASNRRSGLARSAIQRRLSRRGPSSPGQIAGVVAPTAPTRSAPPVAAPTPAPAPTPTGQIYTPRPRRGPQTPAERIGIGGTPAPTPSNPNPAPTQADAAIEHWDQERAVENWQPPIDPVTEANTAELEAERQRFLAELLAGENEFGSAVARRIKSINDQRPQAIESLTNDFAGRGMGYSGRHAVDRGDLEGRFAGMVTDEEESFNNLKRRNEAARGGKNSEIQAAINRVRAESAERNASDPAFRAPVVTTPYPFAGGNSAVRSNAGMTPVVGQDEMSLEAIKRRLAGPWKRL